MKIFRPMVVMLMAAAGSAHAQQVPSVVDLTGTLHLPDGDVIPFSGLASDAARNNFIDTTRGYEMLAAAPADETGRQEETAAEHERRVYDTLAYIRWLTRLRQHFAVVIAPETYAGVQTDVITPREGVSDSNKNRVLINLHGGGMVVGGRYGGQLESVAVASLGRFKVVTVDYRMAPEHVYPAAENDVIAVYRALLKDYRPENIGIFGCSSGAELTGKTVARLIANGEQKPGAIGMFGEGPFGRRENGDSNYIFSGGKPIIKPDAQTAIGDYSANIDMNNPTTYPVEAREIQRQFPPSLLISGTRDLGLSRTVYAHSVLFDLGVNAELHVFEGVPHCAFAQPFVDADVPETQQAWKIIIKFFDNHLGRDAR